MGVGLASDLAIGVRAFAGSRMVPFNIKDNRATPTQPPPLRIEMD